MCSASDLIARYKISDLWYTGKVYHTHTHSLQPASTRKSQNLEVWWGWGRIKMKPTNSKNSFPPFSSQQQSIFNTLVFDFFLLLWVLKSVHIPI